MKKAGDQAFRATGNGENWHELTYAGALSFLRRRYSRDLAGVDVAVSGIPFDSAVTNRPGARLGPRAIRAASVQLQELKSFPYGIDPFEHLSMVDFGDCHLDPHHPAGVADQITEHAMSNLGHGVKPLFLGGDHFIAYPLIKAVSAVHGPVALIQVDAHCDTWPGDGTEIDHGTMFGRAAREGLIDPGLSTQVGLRTYNDSDHGFEILTAPWIHRNGIDAALEIVRQRAGDAPVYLSFDIDALDPAFAPGTGTPVVGGLASWQALEFMRGLQGLNHVAMDLVEVAPAYDHAEITATAAATIAYEWICLQALAKGATAQPVGRL